MSSGRSSTSPAPAAGVQAQLQFPAGLRVLVVDDDATCLKILEKMLRNCHYDVTTCSCAVVALSMLREKKGGFDLVLSDVYMPDMDGFKLLELVGLEMGLPVIMMSVEDRNDVVMKGVNCGAVDYLIKPVRMEAVKNIWQHVVRKRRNELGVEQVGSAEESDKPKRPLDEADNASSANEGNWKNVKRRKDEKEEEDEAEDRDDSSTSKKQRVVWSVELHQQFVAAVNQLGVDKAVPKKILELMNVPGLTRENVASHLQKYRLYLRRVSGPQHPGRLDTQFQGASDATYAPNGLVNGYGLQGLPISPQLVPHNRITLPAGARQVDQMSCFGTNQQIPNTSRMIASGKQWTNDRQMNMITGSCSNLEPWESPQLLQSYGNIGKQASNGASGFLNSLSSLTAGSLLNGGAIIGHQRNSIVMQMSQQAQQFSMSRQQNQLSIDAPKQVPVRGQILNGVAGENDPRLASNLNQQILSNEIPNSVYGREVIANGDASLPGGGFLANNFDPVPQALYSDLQSCFPNESSVNSYPTVSSVGTPDLTSTGMFQESVVPVNGGLDALEGVKEFNSSYDIFGDLHQKKKQDWKLQNLNTYEVPRQSNSVDYKSSIPTHQDILAAIKDRNTRTVSEEIFSIRTETEHRKVECIAQRNSTVLVENSFRVSNDGLPDKSSRDMIFADNAIPNELMNVFSKQQEGLGQVDLDFNLDGYSLDDVLV